MLKQTVQSAIAHADHMLATYGESLTVYVVQGPDPYGRTEVVYCRPAGDAEMEAMVNRGEAVTAYRAQASA